MKKNALTLFSLFAISCVHISIQAQHNTYQDTAYEDDLTYEYDDSEDYDDDWIALDDDKTPRGSTKSGNDTSSSSKVSRVYAGGFGGYSSMDGMYHKDGQFGVFRLTLGCDAYSWKRVTIGVEGGIQSGSTMRLKMAPENRDLAGGLYPQIALKPTFDLLASIRYNFAGKFLLLLKGGAAYREMQLTDRTSRQDSLHSVNGEFQAGLGYQLNKHTRIIGLYQGIYNCSSTDYKLSYNDNVHIGHIPLQQTGFLGIEYAF